MMEEVIISVLGKMTGLTPEQMQGMAERAINLLQNFADDMNTVKDALQRIETQLAIQNGKVIEHVGNDQG